MLQQPLTLWDRVYSADVGAAIGRPRATNRRPYTLYNSLILLFPELLSEGKGSADDADQRYEQQCGPAVEGEIIAGLGVGVVRGSGDLEGAFCFSVTQSVAYGKTHQIQRRYDCCYRRRSRRK